MHNRRLTDSLKLTQVLREEEKMVHSFSEIHVHGNSQLVTSPIKRHWTSRIHRVLDYTVVTELMSFGSMESLVSAADHSCCLCRLVHPESKIV